MSGTRQTEQRTLHSERWHVAERVLATCVIAVLLLGRAVPRPAFPGPASGVVTVRWPTPEALDALGPVWYYTYGFEGPTHSGHHRVFLVPPHYDDHRAAQVLRENPGSWWMVGNEPNDPYQDHLSPTAYAAFYHRFHQLARRNDPLARLMPGGIANADWEWADAFRESYRAMYGRYPKVDAWNVHNYVLTAGESQLDTGIFRERLIAFRRWMDTVGEGHRPLVLSEFGVLLGSRPDDPRHESPEAIAAYIRETVRWLHETEYVQAYAWFADYTGGLFNGDLYDSDGRLNRYGETYRDAIQALASPVVSPDPSERR